MGEGSSSDGSGSVVDGGGSVVGHTVEVSLLGIAEGYREQELQLFVY